MPSVVNKGPGPTKFPLQLKNVVTDPDSFSRHRKGIGVLIKSLLVLPVTLGHSKVDEPFFTRTKILF